MIQIESYPNTGKWQSDLPIIESLLDTYKTLFDEYTPGEQHDRNEVRERLKNDMALGLAALITLEENGNVHGLLWGWMGFQKGEFFDRVAVHAKLVVTDEVELQEMDEVVREALGGQELDWSKTIYVPEIGILEDYRGEGYYQKMIAELARIMREADSEKFIFWALKDKKMYKLAFLTLGAEVLAELPGERSLMIGDSKYVLERYGSKVHAAAA